MSISSRSGEASEGAHGRSHDARIHDQFTQQAEPFARSLELHGEAQTRLIVDATAPKRDDESLDVACGPGTVVAAFATHVRRAVGLDTTDAMLDQARALAFDCIMCRHRRGDVVRFIDNENIELPGVPDMRRENVFNKTQCFP